MTNISSGLAIENDIATNIIGLALDVHGTLGPGLPEAVYKECLYYKVAKAGFEVEKEKVLPVFFEGVRMECCYRIDLLINKRLVIEVKSVKSLNDLHFAQTVSYLKLGNYKLGLLINFNVLKLKDDIRRIINGAEPLP